MSPWNDSFGQNVEILGVKCPKFGNDIHIAKYNNQGISVTETIEVKRIKTSEYKQRFRTRPKKK